MNAELRSKVVDHLLELYCDWRARCDEVRLAYEQFNAAVPADRALAFAAYQAALDREESACDAYEAQTRRVTRALPPVPVAS